MITYNVNEDLEELYKEYELTYWKLRYSMAHRGDKGTDDNVKTEKSLTTPLLLRHHWRSNGTERLVELY